MKCKNCGANYPMRELQCPYCGTLNARGLRQKQQREKAYSDFEKASTEEVGKIRTRMFNRVLNVALVVEIAAFVLVFAGAALYFYSQEAFLDAKKHFQMDEMNAHMEELYTQNRLDELTQYMRENDLNNQENYEYTQAILIGQKIIGFKEARMCYFGNEKPLKEYDADRLVRAIQELLYYDSPAYPELTERNQDLWDTYSRDAETFARAVLGFNDEQLQTLNQNYVPQDEMKPLIEQVMQRRDHDEG